MLRDIIVSRLVHITDKVGFCQSSLCFIYNLYKDISNFWILMVELDYHYPKQFSTMALKYFILLLYFAIVFIAVTCEHKSSYPLLLLLALCDPWTSFCLDCLSGIASLNSCKLTELFIYFNLLATTPPWTWSSVIVCKHLLFCQSLFE